MLKTAAMSILACFLLAGCAGKGPSESDIAPFKAAVDGYCKSKGYGMYVTSVVSLEAADTSATAVCKLKDHEGMYTMAVTWKFTFAAENEAWRVVNHKVQ